MFGLGRRRAAKAAEDELYADEADPAEQQGPFDAGEAPDDGVERLDLGSVRVPVPDGGQLQVEVDPAGPVRAVHMVTGVGRLTVSAFAAPRSGGLWSDVRDELADQLRKDGAQVHTEGGDWGAELVADSPKAALRFVGVDGPRWLLRGVAAGPSDNAAACADLLYQVLDKTVVVRGEDPMPVRTPLPIQLPDEIMQHIQQAQEQQEQSGAGSQTG
ncbi:DUF3710 domain-containing protein [Saccharopolyspora sp. HNM0983]|uniref:DUF3710 domain-containing protein n=1 Tax=Saccharopolyspora montiporae TaxID=2781240 RepID=A0A929FY33_9PSEU|nr:DUF3710 domain-containing protein [Saccharopolyspora sp. HNM0983]MBE9373055.1 DUF3710 domain-containing protein [Saccharopolyspora sp. HNM0983]